MATFNLNYTNLEDIYVVIDGVGRLSLNSTAKTFSFQNPQGIVTLEGACTDSIDNNYHFFWPNGYLGLFRYYAIDLGNGISKWQFEGDVPLVASNPTPQPEPQPTPTPSTDIDLNSGFFETDLQTNITKYFAESFKLKASDFELVNGVVQINPEKLASITVDLTHIVNTSVETQNLTATNATLGTATANSMTASDITATNSTLGDAKANTIEVKNDGLIIEDAEGHKHKFGFTA